MKKGLFLLALGLMSWTVAGSALAGPFGRFARPHPQQQRSLPQSNNDGHEFDNNNNEKERAERPAPNQQPPGQPPAARENNEAHPGANPGQPQMPQQGGQPFGGRGGARMSVEERQKLRRQINEAGRSLYTPPPSQGNK